MMMLSCRLGLAVAAMVFLLAAIPLSARADSMFVDPNETISNDPVWSNDHTAIDDSVRSGQTGDSTTADGFGGETMEVAMNYTGAVTSATNFTVYGRLDGDGFECSDNVVVSIDWNGTYSATKSISCPPNGFVWSQVEWVVDLDQDELYATKIKIVAGPCDNTVSLDVLYAEITYSAPAGGTAPTQNRPIINSSLNLNYTNESLSCWNATTAGDAPIIRYVNWYKNNTLQAGLANYTTIGPANTTKGDNWTCEIKLENDYGSDTQNSSWLYVRNHLPTQSKPGLNSTTTFNYSNETLWCWNVSTADIDNDNVKNMVKWFNNSKAEPSLENYTKVAAGNLTAGQAWICEVTPMDGTAAGAAMNSTPVTLNAPTGNVAPTQGNPILNSTTAGNYTNETLACWNVSTGGTAPVIRYISWYIDSLIQPGLSNYTSIMPDNTTKGQNWTCEVRLENAYGSDARNSTILIVQNHAPNRMAAILNATTQGNYTNETLYCWNLTAGDIDNDAVTVYYNWWRNNSLVIGGENLSALGHGNTTKYDGWICEAIPTDGIQNGSKYNTTSAYIHDHRPTQSLPYIEGVYSDESLRCYNASTADIDGDLVENAYRWYRDGVQQAALSNLTVVGSGNTTANDAWVCEIVPLSVTLAGDARNSTAVTIYTRPGGDGGIGPGIDALAPAEVNVTISPAPEPVPAPDAEQWKAGAIILIMAGLVIVLYKAGRRRK